MAKKRKSIDVDAVRDAARGRWVEILERVAGIPAGLLDGRHHPCPKCIGRDRFRFLDKEAGAVLCNQCFRDSNGDGFAAIQWMKGVSFLVAVKEVADHLGLDAAKIGTSKIRRLATNQLDWRPWNDGIVGPWCVRKPPITIAAVKAAGGRLARYVGQYTVLAFPVWGEKLREADPVGWVLYNTTVGMLPVFANREIVDWVKVKNLSGSRAGFVGVFGNEGLTFKLEGTTDVLSLLSVGLGPGESAICNAFGAGEEPRKVPWFRDFFAGREVVCIGDNDRPGQAGAENWSRFAATAGEASRVVVLPGPVVESHGKDLRDFLEAGGDRQAIDGMVNASQPSEPDHGSLANEADDDPHRLARVNLDRYSEKTGGRVLRFWQGSWWAWKKKRYVLIEEEEFKAKVTESVKAEFDRINMEDLKRYYEAVESGTIGDNDKGPPKAKKVTPQVVGAVINATKGLVYLSGERELDTWIPAKIRRNYISMENGLFDVDAFLDDKDDVLLPHSPDWFSQVHLSYPFDPAAKCPRWESSLELSLEMDPERIKILQEWAGYLLLPNTDQQQFLILEGDGQNGKSAYCAGIEAILGAANVSSVQLESFGDRFSKTETLGKLVNICGDVGELDQVAEGVIKAFTSGNSMMFDRKCKQGIQCAPTARLMIACNSKPRFRDRSDGVSRRTKIVPFTYKIKDSEKVLGMDKPRFWIQSGELPGMFIWALKGLNRLRNQRGFTSSEIGREVEREYKLDSNSPLKWMSENIEAASEEGESNPVRCDFIYKSYSDWALRNGYKPVCEGVFGKEVKRNFPKSSKRRPRIGTSRVYCYYGIAFQDGTEPSPEDAENAFLF